MKPSKFFSLAAISASAYLLAYAPAPLYADLGVTVDPTTALGDNDVLPSNQEIKSVSLDSEASPKARKALLDLVRRGVVIVDVKTYASVEAEKRASWTGSGFIVHIDKNKNEAIIATNHHVAGSLTVSSHKIKFSNGTKAPAKLLYFDPLFDFAFLTVEASKLPKDAVALELSAQPIQLNQTVYTMGNSARDEFSTFKCTTFSLYEILGPFAEQSVNFSGLTVPGASGSPGFNEDGKVVMIVYGGKFTSGSGLPICYLKDALDALKNGQEPSRRSIGIVPEYASLEDLVRVKDALPIAAMQEYLNAFPEANNKVLMINSRIAGTEAEKVFAPGDILWKVNDQFIGPKLYEMDKIINAAKDNQPISVSFYRGSKLMHAKIMSYALDLSPVRNMITFADATWVQNNEFTRFFLGQDKPGVFVMGIGQTSPFTGLFADGLPPFFMDTRLMQITSIDGEPLKTLDDLKKMVPDLMKKREFAVRYIDYNGMMGLGIFAPADRKERTKIMSYESKFDAPKAYSFNVKTHEWDTQDLSDKNAPAVAPATLAITPAPAQSETSSSSSPRKDSSFFGWFGSKDEKDTAADNAAALNTAQENPSNQAPTPTPDTPPSGNEALSNGTTVETDNVVAKNSFENAQDPSNVPPEKTGDTQMSAPVLEQVKKEDNHPLHADAQSSTQTDDNQTPSASEATPSSQNFETKVAVLEEKIEEGAENAAETLHDKAADAAKAVGDAIKNGAEVVKESAENAAEKVSEMAQSGAEKTKATLHRVSAKTPVHSSIKKSASTKNATPVLARRSKNGTASKSSTVHHPTVTIEALAEKAMRMPTSI